MRVQLVPHPSSLHAADTVVAVGLIAGPESVELTYEISSSTPLVLPPVAPCDGAVGERRSGAAGQRRDGLWRHTCCELFARDARVAGPDVAGPYLEFNFSASGDWAAYAFDAPRQGMRAHDWGGAPMIIAERGGCLVRVSLPRIAVGRRLTLSPTVILETATGFGYWALRHPPGQPDFHAADHLAAGVDIT
jgi:hypothetical protein